MIPHLPTPEKPEHMRWVVQLPGDRWDLVEMPKRASAQEAITQAVAQAFGAAQELNGTALAWPLEPVRAHKRSIVVDVHVGPGERR